MRGAGICFLEAAELVRLIRERTFMEDHEFLVAPVSQVPPFVVKQRYVTELNGAPPADRVMTSGTARTRRILQEIL